MNKSKEIFIKRISYLFKLINSRAEEYIKKNGFDNNSARMIAFKELVKEQMQNENFSNTDR